MNNFVRLINSKDNDELYYNISSLMNLPCLGVSKHKFLSQDWRILDLFFSDYKREFEEDTVNTKDSILLTEEETENNKLQKQKHKMLRVKGKNRYIVDLEKVLKRKKELIKTQQKLHNRLIKSAKVKYNPDQPEYIKDILPNPKILKDEIIQRGSIDKVKEIASNNSLNRVVKDNNEINKSIKGTRVSERNKVNSNSNIDTKSSNYNDKKNSNKFNFLSKSSGSNIPQDNNEIYQSSIINHFKDNYNDCENLLKKSSNLENNINICTISNNKDSLIQSQISSNAYNTISGEEFKSQFYERFHNELFSNTDRSTINNNKANIHYNNTHQTNFTNSKSLNNKKLIEAFENLGINKNKSNEFKHFKKLESKEALSHDPTDINKNLMKLTESAKSLINIPSSGRRVRFSYSSAVSPINERNKLNSSNNLLRNQSANRNFNNMTKKLSTNVEENTIESDSSKDMYNTYNEDLNLLKRGSNKLILNSAYSVDVEDLKCNTKDIQDKNINTKYVYNELLKLKGNLKDIQLKAKTDYLNSNNNTSNISKLPDLKFKIKLPPQNSKKNRKESVSNSSKRNLKSSETSRDKKITIQHNKNKSLEKDLECHDNLNKQANFNSKKYHTTNLGDIHKAGLIYRQSNKELNNININNNIKSNSNELKEKSSEIVDNINSYININHNNQISNLNTQNNANSFKTNNTISSTILKRNDKYNNTVSHNQLKPSSFKKFNKTKSSTDRNTITNKAFFSNLSIKTNSNMEQELSVINSLNNSFEKYGKHKTHNHSLNLNNKNNIYNNLSNGKTTDIKVNKRNINNNSNDSLLLNLSNNSYNVNPNFNIQNQNILNSINAINNINTGKNRISNINNISNSINSNIYNNPRTNSALNSVNNTLKNNKNETSAFKQMHRYSSINSNISLTNNNIPNIVKQENKKNSDGTRPSNLFAGSSLSKGIFAKKKATHLILGNKYNKLNERFSILTKKSHLLTSPPKKMLDENNNPTNDNESDIRKLTEKKLHEDIFYNNINNFNDINSNRLHFMSSRKNSLKRAGTKLVLNSSTNVVAKSFNLGKNEGKNKINMDINTHKNTNTNVNSARMRLSVDALGINGLTLSNLENLHKKTNIIEGSNNNILSIPYFKNIKKDVGNKSNMGNNSQMTNLSGLSNDNKLINDVLDNRISNNASNNNNSSNSKIINNIDSSNVNYNLESQLNYALIKTNTEKGDIDEVSNKDRNSNSNVNTKTNNNTSFQNTQKKSETSSSLNKAHFAINNIKNDIIKDEINTNISPDKDTIYISDLSDTALTELLFSYKLKTERSEYFESFSNYKVLSRKYLLGNKGRRYLKEFNEQYQKEQKEIALKRTLKLYKNTFNNTEHKADDNSNLNTEKTMTNIKSDNSLKNGDNYKNSDSDSADQTKKYTNSNRDHTDNNDIDMNFNNTAEFYISTNNKPLKNEEIIEESSMLTNSYKNLNTKIKDFSFKINTSANKNNKNIITTSKSNEKQNSTLRKLSNSNTTLKNNYEHISFTKQQSKKDNLSLNHKETASDKFDKQSKSSQSKCSKHKKHHEESKNHEKKVTTPFEIEDLIEIKNNYFVIDNQLQHNVTNRLKTQSSKKSIISKKKQTNKFKRTKTNHYDSLKNKHKLFKLMNIIKDDEFIDDMTTNAYINQVKVSFNNKVIDHNMKFNTEENKERDVVINNKAFRAVLDKDDDINNNYYNYTTNKESKKNILSNNTNKTIINEHNNNDSKYDNCSNNCSNNQLLYLNFNNLPNTSYMFNTEKSLNFKDNTMKYNNITNTSNNKSNLRKDTIDSVFSSKISKVSFDKKGSNLFSLKSGLKQLSLNNNLNSDYLSNEEIDSHKNNFQDTFKTSQKEYLILKSTSGKLKNIKGRLFKNSFEENNMGLNNNFNQATTKTGNLNDDTDYGKISNIPKTSNNNKKNYSHRTLNYNKPRKFDNIKKQKAISNNNYNNDNNVKISHKNIFIPDLQAENLTTNENKSSLNTQNISHYNSNNKNKVFDFPVIEKLIKIGVLNYNFNKGIKNINKFSLKNKNEIKHKHQHQYINTIKSSSTVHSRKSSKFIKKNSESVYNENNAIMNQEISNLSKKIILNKIKSNTNKVNTLSNNFSYDFSDSGINSGVNNTNSVATRSTKNLIRNVIKSKKIYGK